MTADERTELTEIHEELRRIWGVAKWVGSTFGLAALVGLMWIAMLGERVTNLEEAETVRVGTLERLARIEAIVERIERKQHHENPL